MLSQLYVIHDVKAQIYNAPFTLMNDDVAIRAAQTLLLNPDSEITKNPHDFTMFHLGTYDDETAQINLNSTLKPLVRFHELQLTQQEN